MKPPWKHLGNNLRRTERTATEEQPNYPNKENIEMLWFYTHTIKFCIVLGEEIR